MHINASTDIHIHTINLTHLYLFSSLIPQPKAVSETEEQDLAQLMAKVGQENAEVSGDEEEEEAVA